MREAASVAGPKPLFYKWKPQRQLSLRWFTVWPRSAIAEEASSPPRECGFSQLRRNKTNKHKQTERKRDRRFERREEPSARRRKDTAESFQSCHSGESRRPDNAHKWRISGQPWKHMCKKSKGSGAEEEVWHVQQLCGCRHRGALWSSVLRCDRALADVRAPAQAERLRGWEAARLRLDGPIWSRWEREKGHLPWSKEQLNKVLKHFPKNFRGAQTWSARITKSFLEFFFLCFFFVLQMDRVDQTKTISRGEFLRLGSMTNPTLNDPDAASSTRRPV